MTIHQPRTVTREQHPPAPQTCPLAPGTTKAASTSTPNCMPPSTRPSSSQSSQKQHPPAPQTACPPAPGRQARKAASTSTSNCMPPSTRPSLSQSSINQHLKLHAPQHPAVKLARQHPPAPQTACPLAPGPQSRKAASTSTSNCMPPSTRPSSSQDSIHQHPKLHAPSTQPSSSQKSIHQHPKLHAPEHPAVKLAGQLANQQPPTRPSSSQSSIYQHPKLHAP